VPYDKTSVSDFQNRYADWNLFRKKIIWMHSITRQFYGSKGVGTNHISIVEKADSGNFSVMDIKNTFLFSKV